MAKPSVLFVTYYFPPAGGGGGVQRPAKFIKYLLRLGWDVDVLTTSGTKFYAVDDALVKDVAGVRHVIRAPHGLARVKAAARWLMGAGAAGQAGTKTALSPGKQRLVRTVMDLLHVIPDSSFDWYWPAIAAARRHFAVHDPPSVVFSTALPVTSDLIGWRLSRQLGRPWVCEYRDLWTANLYRPYWLPTKQMLDRSWERRMLQSADLTVSVTPRFVQCLRRLAPNRRDRIRLLRNGYDPEDFPAPAGTSGRPRKGLGEPENPIRMVHTGWVYPERSPVPLFEAIAELYLAEVRPGSFKVDFYGPPVPDVFRRAADRMGLRDDVTFHSYVPHGEAMGILRQTLVKFLIEPSMEAVPGKLYEYAKSGGHILAVAHRDSALAAELRQTKCSTVVTSFTASAVKQALREMLAKARDGMLECGADAEYLRTRSRARQAEQLDAWMRQLIGRSGG